MLQEAGRDALIAVSTSSRRFTLRKRKATQVIDLSSESDEDLQIKSHQEAASAGKVSRAFAGESDEAFARRLHASELAAAGTSSGSKDQSVTVRRAGSGASRLGDPIGQLTEVPHNLIRKVQPLLDFCGTRQEPIIYVKDVDGHRGRLVAELVRHALLKGGMEQPMPCRGERDGIVAEIHSHRRSQTPWRTGLHVLRDVSNQLVEHLLDDPDICRYLPALKQWPGPGWNDTEVLLSTPGCRLSPHHDAQPPGSLLLVYCVGLSALSQAWPDGILHERILESGDVMIFDGKLTRHAVPRVLEGTSPFTTCPWLGHRRLAVLVRQRPPVI